MTQQIERPLSIRMSVVVSDGSFESSISFPVTASSQQIAQTVSAWLQMMDAAVKKTQEVAE